jgi:hypothetical protein
VSYAFSVKAPNKVEAKQLVADRMDDVVKSQPIHARDKAAAVAAAGAMIDLLADDADMHVSVSVNGYVSWREVLRDDASNPLHSANVTAGAALVAPGL